MAEHQSKRRNYGHYLRELLSLVDLAVVCLLFWLLTLLHPEVTVNFARQKWFLMIASYCFVVLFFDQPRLQRVLHIDRIVLGALQVVGVQALVFEALLSFLKINDIPIRYMAEFYLAMFVLLPVTWTATTRFLKLVRSHGRNYIRAVVVGTNATAMRLAGELLHDDTYGYKLYGFFDKAPAPGFKGTYCGTLDDLEAYVRQYKINEVYFALSGEQEEELLHTIRICDDTLVKFFFVPKISPFVGRRFLMDSVGGVPILTPRINPLAARHNRVLKRAFDLLVSSTFLLVSPLIFIPVAIAVKLSSPGPIFFCQKRTGYRGREFNCLKFRTMRVNATADTCQATENDPRKTRVGDFLRRTSIDELPQFINVWLGDMSVVGPRPHMLAHTEEYRRLIDRYMVRHLVMPGITGWAQVCGFRGNTDELWKMEKRVEADMWYIEHWNLLLDVKIILKTIVNGFVGEENAY